MVLQIMDRAAHNASPIKPTIPTWVIMVLGMVAAGLAGAGTLTGLFQAASMVVTTYTVNSTADKDDGQCATFIYTAGASNNEDCTIREAIAAANSHVGFDKVLLPASQAPYLTSAQLTKKDGEGMILEGQGTGVTLATIKSTYAGALTDGAFQLFGKTATSEFTAHNIGFSNTIAPNCFVFEDGYRGATSFTQVTLNCQVGVLYGSVTGNISLTNSLLSPSVAALLLGRRPDVNAVQTQATVNGTVTVENNHFALYAPTTPTVVRGVHFSGVKAAQAVSIKNNTFAATSDVAPKATAGIVATSISAPQDKKIGTRFQGAGVTIQDNTFSYTANDFSSAPTGAIVVQATVTGATNFLAIRNNKIDALRSPANNVVNGTGIIYAADTNCGAASCTGIANATVEGNIITVRNATVNDATTDQEVIHVAATNSVVTKNSVHFNNSGNVSNTRGLINCTQATTVAATCEVSYNKLDTFTGVGIQVLPSVDKGTLTAKVFENWISNGSGSSASGIRIGTGTSTDFQKTSAVSAFVYNNSVRGIALGNSGLPRLGEEGAVVAKGTSTQTTTINAFNNIIADSDRGLASLGGSKATINSQNNLLWNNGVNGAASNFFAVAKNASDIEADPHFVSTTELGIAYDSPALNKGASSAFGTTIPSSDFFGVAIPQGDAPEIGLQELVNRAPTVSVAVDSGTHNIDRSVQCNASDPDGNNISVTWEIVSGLGLFLDSQADTTSFRASGGVGNYTLRCTASDGKLTKQGEVSFSIANATPTANMNDVTYTYEEAPAAIPLECNAHDNDNDLLAYQWEQLTGPDTVLSDPSSASPTIPKPGPLDTASYTFKCTVTDIFAMSASAQATVTINGSANLVHAGTNRVAQTVPAGVECTSEIPNANFTWSVAAAHTATNNSAFANANSASTTFESTPFFGQYDLHCTASGASKNGSADFVLFSQDETRQLYGQTRYGTAVAISKEKYPTERSVQSVVIASGEFFPDAITASPLARQVNAPILLVNRTGLPADTKDEIARVWDGNTNNGTDVYVIGGNAVVPDSVVTQITELNSNIKVTRLAGATRYETSVAVARELDKTRTGTVGLALVNGTVFSDGLIAGSAWATQTRILLVSPAGANTAVKQYLLEQNNIGVFAPVHIIGTNNALPSSVSDLAKTINSNFTCYCGSDPITTAAQFANDRFGVTDLTHAGLATIQSFPDALAGSILGLPILFTDGATLPEASRNFLAARQGDYTAAGASVFYLAHAYIFGGPAVVPQTTIDTIKATLTTVP